MPWDAFTGQRRANQVAGSLVRMSEARKKRSHEVGSDVVTNQ